MISVQHLFEDKRVIKKQGKSGAFTYVTIVRSNKKPERRTVPHVHNLTPHVNEKGQPTTAQGTVIDGPVRKVKFRDITATRREHENWESGHKTRLAKSVTELGPKVYRKDKEKKLKQTYGAGKSKQSTTTQVTKPDKSVADEIFKALKQPTNWSNN